MAKAFSQTGLGARVLPAISTWQGEQGASTSKAYKGAFSKTAESSMRRPIVPDYHKKAYPDVLKDHLVAGSAKAFSLFKERDGAKAYGFERDAVKLAGSVNNAAKFSEEAEKFEEKHGCKVVATTTGDINNLRAVAIDLPGEERHIAIAGTDIKSYADLKDDFNMAVGSALTKAAKLLGWSSDCNLHIVPAKFGSVKQWSEQLAVVPHYFSEQKPSVKSVSGHSLGGLTAQMLAAELIARGEKVTSAKLFDAPGGKDYIVKAVQDGMFTQVNEGVDLLKATADISDLFVKRENAVNTHGKQLGRVYVVYDPQERKYLDELSWYLKAGIFGCLRHIIPPIADQLLYDCIDPMLRAFTAHRLGNFKDGAKVISMGDVEAVEEEPEYATDYANAPLAAACDEQLLGSEYDELPEMYYAA